MKIINKKDSERWEDKTAVGYEYPFQEKNIDCAVIEIFGRHPLNNTWCRNALVDEMVYCKKGHGKIVFENTSCDMIEDSAVLISKGEWYYWDESTNGVFVFCCNPAWTKNQIETKD